MRAPFAALLVLVATLALGIWLGGHSGSLPGPLRDFARGEDAARIDAAMEKIEDDYYTKVSKDQLADDAVRGMVEGLDDRFSAYFDEREYARFKEISDARFSGVGLGIQKAGDGLRVVQVYDKSPAKKAGLRIGDVIVAANGTKLAGKPEEAATGLIKGEPGTKVTLTVRRKKETFDRRLTRAQIAIPVVSSRERRVDGKDYAVIRLETFSSGAHAEVYSAVRKAVDGKVDGIVFDMRGNGGGLVEEARLIASAFLEEGKIVTTRGRAVPERVYRATGRPVAPKTPMVVLVDKGTASAAEIVAGALQDRDRARLVGTSTFGKGVFQEIVELSEGGALDITVGQYFLPSGRNIGGKGTARGAGLKPDVKARDDPDTPRVDEGLDGALDALGSGAASAS
jgi:carboxyl-terminal processing protease